MSTCGKIAADLLIDCDYQIIPGVTDNLLLINVDDIDRTQGTDGFTLNGTNPQIIEGIFLKSTKEAYLYEGQRQSITGLSEMTPIEQVVGYRHQIDFKVFATSPTIKAELEKLAKGKVIAILKNNYINSTGNSAYELYGKQVGLQVTVQTRSTTENGGAFMVTLSTPENYIEGHMPNTVFLTNLATTEALVEALYTPAS